MTISEIKRLIKQGGIKIIAVYKPERVINESKRLVRQLEADEVLEAWVTLGEADISRTEAEIFSNRKLPYPPDWYLIKIGKRRWYELV